MIMIFDQNNVYIYLHSFNTSSLDRVKYHLNLKILKWSVKYRCDNGELVLWFGRFYWTSCAKAPKHIQTNEIILIRQWFLNEMLKKIQPNLTVYSSLCIKMVFYLRTHLYLFILFITIRFIGVAGKIPKIVWVKLVNQRKICVSNGSLVDSDAHFMLTHHLIVDPNLNPLAHHFLYFIRCSLWPKFLVQFQWCWIIRYCLSVIRLAGTKFCGSFFFHFIFHFMWLDYYYFVNHRLFLISLILFSFYLNNYIALNF